MGLQMSHPIWYNVYMKTMKKEKKTFKVTLADGEIVTLKTWGMCGAASKTVDLDVVKIEECSVLEWATHQTLQPNEELQVTAG